MGFEYGDELRDQGSDYRGWGYTSWVLWWWRVGWEPQGKLLDHLHMHCRQSVEWVVLCLLVPSQQQIPYSFTNLNRFLLDNTHPTPTCACWNLICNSAFQVLKFYVSLGWEIWPDYSLMKINNIQIFNLSNFNTPSHTEFQLCYSIVVYVHLWPPCLCPFQPLADPLCTGPLPLCICDQWSQLCLGPLTFVHIHSWSLDLTGPQASVHSTCWWALFIWASYPVHYLIDVQVLLCLHITQSPLLMHHQRCPLFR